MQINNKTFEKFTTKLAKYVANAAFLSFLLLSHVFTRFLISFLQDCEDDMKYFVVMDIYFFIYNVLRAETFILGRT